MLNSGEPDVTLEHVPSLPASIVREKKGCFLRKPFAELDSSLY